VALDRDPGPEILGRRDRQWVALGPAAGDKRMGIEMRPNVIKPFQVEAGMRLSCLAVQAGFPDIGKRAIRAS
jgi:hypothetical protein